MLSKVRALQTDRQTRRKTDATTRITAAAFSLVIKKTSQHSPTLMAFLPRCMQCRLQTRSSDENSVCPSAKRVICDKLQERSVWIFISYERSSSLVFWEEVWLVGATPSTWNFWSTGPRWSEKADFQPIFARSSSAVTPSEKVQLTLIGSPLRAFQWAYETIIIRCP